ncbi:hypothetical protein [Enhygromyxa salina]|uniref:Tetratricopeptide repeat protein n=1 Tax=Enhygromyxa salina TaxID=215803 RepID=A0A2S9YMK8_9BACT|nr:hypothetical protein [Enhygromyxa salina]PRQ06311.1 hypothetical protein ENSA7_39880 [Enhygromyxa salina]
MTELDPRIHASIGRSLRQGSHSPPAGVEDHMLAQFHAALGGPPDGGLSGAEPGSGPALAGGGQVVHAIKIVAAVIGLTTVGLGGVALVGKVVRGARTERAPIVSASLEPDPAEGVSQESELVANEAVDSSAPPEPPEVVEPSPSTSQPSSARTPSPTSTSSSASATLAAELQLIRAARNAPAAQALALLDQHAEQFPNGELANEREGLRVIALCELDRFDEAQRAGERFVAGSPGKLLVQRVESACRNKFSLPTTEPEVAGHR